MKYAFAGDRELSVNILKFLVGKNYIPSAIIIGDNNNNSHAHELSTIVADYGSHIVRASDLHSPESIEILSNMNLDYIFGIHFPHIIRKSILDIPKVGMLNLHPAYLPYNKGWHTPSWAIIDNSCYGATLHFMSEELDAGDIILQRKIDISPNDTANSLYQKVLKLEYDVFVEAFDDLLSLQPNRTQQTGSGSSYAKKDLEKVALLDMDKDINTGELIKLLRALTTNNVNEACHFIKDGKKYAIQVNITELEK